MLGAEDVLEALRLIRFIKHAQEIGFSLREIIRRALHRLIDHCDGDVPVRECAIIEALDEVAEVENANASENGRAST
jgi:DNA-binding transcriptional MerR regulator